MGTASAILTKLRILNTYPNLRHSYHQNLNNGMVVFEASGTDDCFESIIGSWVFH